MFCNNSAVVHSYETLEPLRSTSDHYVLEVKTPLLCSPETSEGERPPLVAVLDNLDFHSNDIQWEEMSKSITECVEAENFANLSPNEHLAALMKILIDIAYKFVPCKKSSQRGSHTKRQRA